MRSDVRPRRSLLRARARRSPPLGVRGVGRQAAALRRAQRLDERFFTFHPPAGLAQNRPSPPPPKTALDCPKMPPRRHQENTRRTRGGTRRLEDGPRLPRVSRRLPKDCPKTAQDSSRAPQDLLQDGPRWPLRGPEATRGAPESVPRSPQLSWGVRGCIGTSIIVLMFVAAPSASTSSSSPTSPSS